MFEAVLIANRGEIAVRIARTLRQMGIRSVVTASIPDHRSLAVRSADDCVLLEGYSAAETYLDQDAIIKAARERGCGAIHPGYGFLAERADFAERCAAEGLVFIGPPPEVLRTLGDKSAARRLAVANDVPVVPGWDGADDQESLVRAAVEIGFPVMVKARGGGGGRGMRVVESEGELPEALASARREADAAFGDPGLLIEKLVTDAHHVEVQIFGDRHGNLVHMGERDCSVQRRHQKLIEESPSPVVDDELRGRLTEAALRIGRAAGYVNAGTVEFLVGAPGQDGRRPFYFLEVNPRLQVEHPVTEAVTGLDLVEWQLRVAAGEPLPARQEDIIFTGHAIEFRINAEDPLEEFRPSSGRITRAWPFGEKYGRTDAGYELHDVVPAQYDSLLWKVIVDGGDRCELLERFAAIAGPDDVRGVRTNVALLGAVARSDVMRAGEATVDWLESALAGLIEDGTSPPEAWVCASAGALLLEGGQAPPAWLGAGVIRCWLDDGQTVRDVAVALGQTRRGVAEVDGARFEFRWASSPESRAVQVLVGEASREVVGSGDGFVELLGGGGGEFALVPPPPLPRRVVVGEAGATAVVAPLAGTVAAVAVEVGQEVEPGQLLLSLEAMKMEHRVTSDVTGVVTEVAVGPGDVVREGDLLARLA